MTTIERYAKAIVGLLGVTTTVILATVPPNTALWTWASVVAGVLTVLGIGSVPNQYGVTALRAKLADAERALEPGQPLSVMDYPHPEDFPAATGAVRVCTGGADCPVPGHTGRSRESGERAHVLVCTGGVECQVPGHTGVPHPPDRHRT